METFEVISFVVRQSTRHTAERVLFADTNKTFNGTNYIFFVFPSSNSKTLQQRVINIIPGNSMQFRTKIEFLFIFILS
jgi:hypothetical protein